MDEVTGLLRALSGTGPLGAALAAVIIGFGLVLIVFARARDLWGEGHAKTQELGFQDRLLRMIDDLRASEQALRAKLDAMERETGSQRLEIDELRVDVAMLRNQRRRLIEMMRARQVDHPLVELAAGAHL